MSAPAFTPPPWNISDSGMSVYGQANRPWIAVTADGRSEAERKANVHLIAAAPELYALVEQFERVAEYELRKMQREKPEDDEGIRLRQLSLNLIRAALAKARGEQ